MANGPAPSDRRVFGLRQLLTVLFLMEATVFAPGAACGECLIAVTSSCTNSMKDIGCGSTNGEYYLNGLEVCGYNNLNPTSIPYGTCILVNPDNNLPCTYCPAGIWSNWVQQGGCSTSCGTGSVTFTRRTPDSCRRNGQDVCAGGNSKTEPCSAGPARTWSGWQDSGTCSTTCGTGTKPQSRSCTGCTGSCSGSSVQTVACSAGPAVSWSAWSDAGGCSVTCGSGTKPQQRSCDGCVGSCSGSATQSVSCFMGTPNTWTSWGNVGTCSVPCGSGLQLQTRSCTGGSCGTCAGASSQSIPCYNAAKSWTNWADASLCSSTCGTGSLLQTRVCGNGGTCGDCAGDSSRLIACTSGAPQSWSSWSNSGACSVNCGTGVQLQVRDCNGCYGGCDGAASQSIACSAGATKAWTSWAVAGPCNTTCGAGFQLQNRSCLGCLGDCAGMNTQVAPCTAGVSKTWSAWTNSTPCSAQCGSGTLTQTRTCSGCTGDCVGSASQTVSCVVDQPYTWTPWYLPPGVPATCSSDCTQPRMRQCQGCSGITCIGAATGVGSCYNGSWTSWTVQGACSTTCGTGQLSYARQCLGCPQSCIGAATREETCSAGVPREWGAWFDGGLCSVTCGDGMKLQNRTCNGCVGACVGSETQLVPCSAGITPRMWTAWANVTGVCDNTCGIGWLAQRRACIGCVGECAGTDTQQVSCSAGLQKEWSVWADITHCAQACSGADSKQQTRACVGCVGACPASDANARTVPCNDTSMRAWTPWGYPANSVCDASCVRSQIRNCAGCTGPVCAGVTTKLEPCAEQYWSEWAPVGSCDASCGEQRVTRSCIGCNCSTALAVRFDICGRPPPGTWGLWGCCNTSNRLQTRLPMCACQLSRCSYPGNGTATQACARGALPCTAPPDSGRSKSIGATGSNVVSIAVPVAVLLAILAILGLLLIRYRRKNKRRVPLSEIADMTNNPLYLGARVPHFDHFAVSSSTLRSTSTLGEPQRYNVPMESQADGVYYAVEQDTGAPTYDTLRAHRARAATTSTLRAAAGVQYDLAAASTDLPGSAYSAVLGAAYMDSSYFAAPESNNTKTGLVYEVDDGAAKTYAVPMVVLEDAYVEVAA